MPATGVRVPLGSVCATPCYCGGLPYYVRPHEHRVPPVRSAPAARPYNRLQTCTAPDSAPLCVTLRPRRQTRTFDYPVQLCPKVHACITVARDNILAPRFGLFKALCPRWFTHSAHAPCQRTSHSRRTTRQRNQPIRPSHKHLPHTGRRRPDTTQSTPAPRPRQKWEPAVQPASRKYPLRVLL